MAWRIQYNEAFVISAARKGILWKSLQREFGNESLSNPGWYRKLVFSKKMSKSLALSYLQLFPAFYNKKLDMIESIWRDLIQTF